MSTGLDGFRAALRRYGRRIETVPAQIAPFLVATVQRHIREADSPPNAPLTLKLKGGKGPLKDTGALRARITYRLRGLDVIVGTSGVQDAILHHGGTITPKAAKKLAIPATRKIKAASEGSVRGYLDRLKAAGWRVHFAPRAIIGTPPRGTKGEGLRIKAKPRPRAKPGRKRLPQRAHYVLFIRRDSVTIPARPYMELRPDEVTELKAMARRLLAQGL